MGTFTDDFNRPDEGLGDSPNWDGYTSATVGYRVEGNEVNLKGGAGAERSNSPVDQPGDPDMYAQYRNRQTGSTSAFTDLRICLRFQDNNNCVAFRLYTGSIQVYERTGGSFNQLGSNIGHTPVLDETWRFEVSGNDYKLTLGALEYNYTSGAHAAQTGVGTVVRQGGSGKNNPFFDDWESGPLAAPPQPPGDNTDLKFWWKPSDSALQTNPPQTYPVNGTVSEQFSFTELANGQYYDAGGVSIVDNPANTPRYTHDPDNANLPVGLLSSEDVATEQFIDYGVSNQPPWWNGLEGIWYIDLYYDADATPVDTNENEYYIYLNTGNQNFFIIWLNDDQFRARFEVGGGSRNLTYVQPVGPSANLQPVQRFRIAVGFRETPAEMYMYIGQEGVDLGAGVGEAIKSGERLVSIGSSSINPQVMRMWGFSSGNRPRRVSTPEVRFYDVFQSEQFLQDLASGRDVETQPPVVANQMAMVI